MEDYYQKPETNYQPPMNYNMDGKKNNNLKIFAIALAIFAIVSIIIAIGIFFITKNQKVSLDENKNVLPTILIVENEETLTITANYHDTLEKLIYTWADNPDQTIPGDGDKKITTTIQKPIGTYMLKVKVVAQDGNEAFEEKEFTQDVGPDMEKPKIDFEITDSKKLKITVTDNVGLKSFKYFWNEDVPTEVSIVEGDPRASIELNILKDRNKITVIAVDQSDLETTEEKEYTGKEIPEITLFSRTDKKAVIVTVKHEKGISEIITILNDKEDKKTYEGDNIKDEIKLQINLHPGNNIVEVRAKSVDGEVATIKGSAESPASNTQDLQTQTQTPTTQTQTQTQTQTPTTQTQTSN